jgi:2-dehydropantoate 2-reductase
MRIVVFGAGAVGGYFGGRLAQSGADVFWFARGATLAALRTRGLSVESLRGDFALPPQRATDRAEEIEHADVVLLGVKAWQVAAAAAVLRPWLGAESVVLPLQNGIEIADQLIAVLGIEPVMGGLCKIACEVVEPGHLRHFGAEPGIDLGPLPVAAGELAGAARSERQRGRCLRLAAAFDRAGVAVRVREDIAVGLWEKFLFIASTSGVGAFLRAPFGVVRSQPETRELLQQAMREVEAIALARGVGLPADVVERALAFVDRMPAETTTSMQRDLQMGRPSELEAQNGAVVRLGRAAGVATPVHERLYASLAAGIAGE